jgi:hypothetical protein
VTTHEPDCLSRRGVVKDCTCIYGHSPKADTRDRGVVVNLERKAEQAGAAGSVAGMMARPPEKTTFEDDIERRLDEIRQLADRGDSDGAHGEEDDLYLVVLQEIANGHRGLTRVRHLARQALRSQDFDFPRHTA